MLAAAPGDALNPGSPTVSAAVGDGGVAAWTPGSTLRRALWLAPVLFAAHNAEEGVSMARWTARELPGLLARVREALPPGLLPPALEARLYAFQPPSAAQFWWAAGIATVVPLILYWLAAARGPRSRWTSVAVWLQAMFCLNVFIPHLALSLWLRRYTPGVATGLLLNLPLSLVIFRGALRERIVSRRALAVFFASALVACGALIGMLLALGRLLAQLTGAA